MGAAARRAAARAEKPRDVSRQLAVQLFRAGREARARVKIKNCCEDLTRAREVCVTARSVVGIFVFVRDGAINGRRL